MIDRIKNQFLGFIATQSLFLKNDIIEYSFFHTDEFVPALSSEEVPVPVNSVLGKRMEEYFRFYVDNYSEEQVIAFNEQIIQENVTVGELDFILKNSRTSQISHVELVYKFYLYDPDFSKDEIERWIGPNKRDFLVKKIERLKQHQFPLLEHPATVQFLRDKSLSAELIEQKLCFKANLFLPLNHHLNSEVANPAAVQGFWIREEEFTEKQYGNCRFFSPRKQDWPILPQHNEVWITYNDFLPQVQQLLNQNQSTLVWMKNVHSSFERFFIVWW